MNKIYVLLLTLFVLSSEAHAASAPKGIPGVEGPFLNFVDGKILITMLLTEVELEGGLEVPIPRTNRSTASLQPNVMGGSMVTVSISQEDIKEALNVDVTDSWTLPCGRPIPGIAGGELKDGIRIDLPEDKYNLSFYYHKKIFGVYVPFNFDLPNGVASITLNWKGKPVGAIAIVGKEGDKRAAGTIFLRPEAILGNKEIMDLMNRAPGELQQQY